MIIMKKPVIVLTYNIFLAGCKHLRPAKVAIRMRGSTQASLGAYFYSMIFLRGGLLN